MNLYALLQRIWRNKRIAAGCAALSIVVALIVGFRISLSPPSISPRALQLGVASVQVLVDSRETGLSELSSGADNQLATLASTYTELMNSPRILDPVARAIGVAPQNIGVQEQITQLVPLAQGQPLEPQVGTEILSTRQHYYIDARNDSGSQVVSIFTQAPSGAIAVKMAAAAARALIRYAAVDAHTTHPPPLSRQVVLRQVGGPYGRTLNRSAALQAAILVGVVLWVVLMIASLTLQSQARRARLAGLDRQLSEA